MYGYDRRNARMIAFGKGDGHYIAQYRLADGADGWEDMRGFYVAPPGDDPEAPPVIVWISRDGVHQATLEAVDRRTRGFARPVRGYIRSSVLHALAGRSEHDPAPRLEPVAAPPVVTPAIIVVCFVVFAWSSGCRRRRRPALEEFVTAWGVVPAELLAAGAPAGCVGPGDGHARHQPVPARRLAAPARQPALPVDLREQRRGSPRAACCSPLFFLGGGVVAGADPDRSSTPTRRSRWSGLPGRSPRRSARISCSGPGRASCRSSSSASSTSSSRCRRSSSSASGSCSSCSTRSARSAPSRGGRGVLRPHRRLRRRAPIVALAA